MYMAPAAGRRGDTLVRSRRGVKQQFSKQQLHSKDAWSAQPGVIGAGMQAKLSPLLLPRLSVAAVGCPPAEGLLRESRGAPKVGPMRGQPSSSATSMPQMTWGGEPELRASQNARPWREGHNHSLNVPLLCLGAWLAAATTGRAGCHLWQPWQPSSSRHARAHHAGHHLAGAVNHSVLGCRGNQGAGGTDP